MSDYLDPNNQELLKDFFAEARSQVDALEQNILVLENDPANRDAVDEIFRAAHTLKGGAGTVEMTELAAFTHIVEDLLDAIRSDAVKVTEDVIDALLAAIDIIKAMLDSRADGQPYRKDISGQRSRLESLVPGRKATALAARTSSIPVQPTAASVSSGLSEYEMLEMREAAGADRAIYVMTVEFDESNVMNTVSPIHVFAALRDVGTVLKTIPDFEKLYEDQFRPQVTYFIASSRTADELERIAFMPDVVTSVSAAALTVEGNVDVSGRSERPQAAAQAKPADVKTVTSRMGAAPAIQVPPAIRTPPVVMQEPGQTAGMIPAADVAPGETVVPELGDTEEKSGDGRKSSQQSGSILRVDSRRIDNLLNLVSETVINKATFNQISSQFTDIQGGFSTAQGQFREKLKELFDELPDYLAAIQAGRSVKDIKKEVIDKYGGMYGAFDAFEGAFKTNVAKFRSTAQNLGRITSELQEGVMRIRMVPISQIFNRFPRLVRDLSKTLSKRVNLVIEGEETELDKSVIEDLLDPLMHAVRNGLDHGVESVDERRAVGKAEEGTILLRASNEGNMIIIEIADDGKGIDVEAVKRKAVERGIIHPNKALTELESFNLIFEPGFSTAASITNISGRGVGLDVVKRQIEKLNGMVTVSSQRGKGTKFTIKLPLTLAIIQGLLVRVGKEIYSIPITSVIESHRIKPSDIKMIDNYEVFNVRNDVVSLLRLNRLFRIQTNERSDYCFVVVVGTSEKRVGLMVDSLIGEEDVVIKPLHDQFTNSPGIAGASILGDGSVCLIIDVSQLLELGQKKELEERQRLEMSIR